MASFEYYPLATAIRVKWRCPNCGCENCSDDIAPPMPDFSAETNHDSVQSEYFDDVCEGCDHQIEITLSTGMWSADGDVDIDDDDFLGIEEDEEIPDEMEESFYSNEAYTITRQETNEMLLAIDPLAESVKTTLYGLLYANIISKMEVFLCDTIVRYVMSDEAHKQHFVQTYDPLATQNFPMRAIYAKYKMLDKLIKDSLTAIVYHDIELVSKLYKKNTGIDVNPDEVIKEAIKKRHDIVHRNGKDKDGSPVIISKENIEELADHVGNFIEDIEQKVSSVEFEELLKSFK